jgi:hypothetical protein
MGWIKPWKAGAEWQGSAARESYTDSATPIRHAEIRGEARDANGLARLLRVP